MSSSNFSGQKSVEFIDPETLWYGNGPYIQINSFAQVIKDAYEKANARGVAHECDGYQLQALKTILEFGNYDQFMTAISMFLAYAYDPDFRNQHADFGLCNYFSRVSPIDASVISFVVNALYVKRYGRNPRHGMYISYESGVTKARINFAKWVVATYAGDYDQATYDKQPKRRAIF